MCSNVIITAGDDIQICNRHLIISIFNCALISAGCGHIYYSSALVTLLTQENWRLALHTQSMIHVPASLCDSIGLC